VSESPAPYFLPASKRVGKDIDPNALIVEYGDSGAGKSHTGSQLLAAPDFGPDEVQFIASEDVTSIYGEGARVVQVDRFDTAVEQVRLMLAAKQKGARMPKVTFIDSISGLAHGTQAYYREHPITVFNEKTNEYVRNKFAEFGEVGTGMLDLMLLLAQLPGIKVALCTTFTDPVKAGAVPELAVEGKMIPKFLTQLSTCALFLKEETNVVARQDVEAAAASGTLLAPHRIVPTYKPTDPVVKIIERYFYSQGGGEVKAKGHRNLAVRERADLPAIIRKIMGKKEDK
jgi:hypothetical protein